MSALHDRRGVAPLIVAFLALALAGAVAVGAPVAYDSAFGDATNPKHGLLWRLELAGEALKLALSLSPGDRAARHLQLAEERLSELEACADDPALARELCARYGEHIDACLALARAHGLVGLQALVANATARHQRVLERLLALVPDEARPWVQMAMERSMRGHEEASRAVERATGMGYEEYIGRYGFP